MKCTMSAHAAVFRTDALMAEGKEKLAATLCPDAGLLVTDRSLIWKQRPSRDARARQPDQPGQRSRLHGHHARKESRAAPTRTRISPM